MSKTGKRGGLLREPLLHFLVIGVLVFGAHSLWSARQGTAERTISISSAEIQRLTGIWASEAGREPTTEDVQALIAEYVREEVLYREALRLGLERDDTIIRRRLAQKMGFLVQRDEETSPLSEAELRAAFEVAPDIYTRPTRLSFVHVPFNFAQGGEARDEDIAAALTALTAPNAEADWMKLGDPFLLSRTHADLSETEMARLFGREFASTLFTLEGSDWSGPHRSRLAWHLVRVEKRTEGGVPDFADIIEEVRTRETEQRKRAANDAEMTKLLERYTIILNDGPA